MKKFWSSYQKVSGQILPIACSLIVRYILVSSWDHCRRIAQCASILKGGSIDPPFAYLEFDKYWHISKSYANKGIHPKENWGVGVEWVPHYHISGHRRTVIFYISKYEKCPGSHPGFRYILFVPIQLNHDTSFPDVTSWKFVFQLLRHGAGTYEQ